VGVEQGYGDGMKKPFGRPTDYTPEAIEKARAYVDGGWINDGDQVPTIAGLAIALDVSRETVRAWGHEAEQKPDFSAILGKLGAKQEQKLVNSGLTGEFSSPIAKMMLTKHGYSDSVKSEHSGPNGGSIPVEIKRTFVDPKE